MNCALQGTFHHVKRQPQASLSNHVIDIGLDADDAQHHGSALYTNQLHLPAYAERFAGPTTLLRQLKN